MYWDAPSPPTERVKHGWEWGRIVWFGLIILHTKFRLPSMPRSGLKVPGGWVVVVVVVAVVAVGVVLNPSLVFSLGPS